MNKSLIIIIITILLLFLNVLVIYQTFYPSLGLPITKKTNQDNPEEILLAIEKIESKTKSSPTKINLENQDTIMLTDKYSILILNASGISGMAANLKPQLEALNELTILKQEIRTNQLQSIIKFKQNVMPEFANLWKK